MLIPIEKIVVKDRIRKDFGNIRELADDIKDNGLINPPVINKNYELLAGERRLRACKSLGWEQIPVTMMDTRDAEHELNIEISENDVRKGFSKAERADYMKRLLRIEQAKAKKRQTLGEKIPEGGRAKDKAAERFGISGKTMEREIAISDNKDLIDPSDFADWDEGKLSTNKMYQKLKRESAEKDRKIKELENRELEVKTVVKEVVPGDYREAKSKAKAYDAETRRLNKRLEDAYKERNYLQDRVAELEGATKEGLDTSNLSENVFYFCTICNNFIGNVGGLVWLTDRIADMPEKQRDMFLKASNSFRDWSLAFTQNLERRVNEYEQTAEFDSRVPVLTDKESRRQD